jgi:hypothetical protein
MDLDVELADCEGRLGSIPRQLPLEDRGYLDVPTPTWAKGDELRWYFATRERLLTFTQWWIEAERDSIDPD